MPDRTPTEWVCEVCGYVYDENQAGVRWEDLPDDWKCPVCGATKEQFKPVNEPAGESAHADQPTGSESDGYLQQWARSGDEVEPRMVDIHRMAETGHSISEPMRSKVARLSWGDILIKGAQLARIPRDRDEPASTKTVIGRHSKHPLTIETPVYITHMSFGALSREVKLALAKGSATVGTAMCSGEGGIIPESLASAHRYIFEYVPNRYSVTDENLRKVDAIEIKVGQSAKPGLGGHLPGDKVTDEISEVRGFPVGVDIHSPARFKDITNRDELKKKVAWLRERSGGKPIGIKFAAGDVEGDLEVALYAEPDFITIDGRPGATASAPKFIKDSTSVPTIFALHRARKYLDAKGADQVSLLITGGFRVSSDFAKALALGADAVAIGSAAMMACGCQQYRVCNTGKCPVGVATQDPQLRARIDIEQSAKRLENFLRVCTDELRDFTRLTGYGSIHDLGIGDLCTTNSEISGHTAIAHV